MLKGCTNYIFPSTIIKDNNNKNLNICLIFLTFCWIYYKHKYNVDDFISYYIYKY